MANRVPSPQEGQAEGSGAPSPPTRAPHQCPHLCLLGVSIVPTLRQEIGVEVRAERRDADGDRRSCPEPADGVRIHSLTVRLVTLCLSPRRLAWEVGVRSWHV